jgi:hypothetical protein
MVNQVNDVADENTPLLKDNSGWTPPKGFWWMETGTMQILYLEYLTF